MENWDLAKGNLNKLILRSYLQIVWDYCSLVYGRSSILMDNPVGFRFKSINLVSFFSIWLWFHNHRACFFRRRACLLPTRRAYLFHAHRAWLFSHPWCLFVSTHPSGLFISCPSCLLFSHPLCFFISHPSCLFQARPSCLFSTHRACLSLVRRACYFPSVLLVYFPPVMLVFPTPSRPFISHPLCLIIFPLVVLVYFHSRRACLFPLPSCLFI